MSLEIDHVVFCVADLGEASSTMMAEHGLESLGGGRHAGHGTANLIVPLGDSYLELVAIADAEEAEKSPFGRWVGSRAEEERLVPHALCLRTDDLDPIVDRLGLSATGMSRERPDGRILRWRLAGLEATLAEGMPFFIEWDIAPGDHPARSTLPQADGRYRPAVCLRGDRERLERWVSGADAAVASEGAPAVEYLRLRATRTGEAKVFAG